MEQFPAYSDDGLDVCGVSAHIPGAKNWSGVIDGKHFWVHNPFRCPHCGEPYVDYYKYPQLMKFGVYACVHLGRTVVEVPETATE